jgi:hypothetical protein
MKKFRQLSEQYREEGRHKLIYPKNKAVVSPRPENDSAKAKLGEEVSTPPIGVRSLYTKMYAKHGGTAAKTKDAQSKAYAEVEKKHGKEMRNSLEAFHKKNMNEEKDEREYDYEGEMVKSDLRSIMANAERITDLLEDDDNLPEWCQNKITLAEDYISTVANYLTAEMNESVKPYVSSVSPKLGEKGSHDVMDKEGKVVKSFPHNKDGMKAAQAHLKKMKEEVEQISESGGDVVYKKGDHHIEKYGEDAFALYSNGKKQKYYTSIEAAKEAMKEEVELDEENKPTNPELWARAKAMAKSKFDVYPSAYANGWAAKWYKSKGGGWRSVNEENYEVTVMHTTKDGDKGEKTHKITNANDSRHAKNIALQRHEKMLSSKGKEVRGMATTTAKMVEAKKDDLPFTPDKPKKKSVVVGKKPEGYSVARHLARQAMQKYMKKPVKEENMSKKTKIVKDVMKKSSSDDKFQAEPMISQSIIRNN